MDRRSFLNKLSITSAGMLVLPTYGIKAYNKPDNQREIMLKAGVCADVHRDFMPDSILRLQTFIDSMNERGDIDFIIQLGDFSCPHDDNIPFMDVWNQFKGPAYHVIGNHEYDGGFTEEQVVSFFGSEGAYYSFDTKGYHFVVLNGNDPHPDKPDRPRSDYISYIGEEQRRWLADDLDKTSLPVIAFSHQSIDEKLNGVEQSIHTRLVCERANEKAGFRKVRLIFSGHHHTDFHNTIHGIHHLSINSMSFIWIGLNYEHECKCWSKEIEEKYHLLKHLIPYNDPLWAVMTIYSDGEIAIEGRQTGYTGPPPEELGLVSPWYVPRISDRRLTNSG